MNKLLMEENDRLQKQVSQLVYENGYFRQHTQSVSFAVDYSIIIINFFPFPIHGVSSKMLIVEERNTIVDVK